MDSVIWENNMLGIDLILIALVFFAVWIITKSADTID